MELCIYNILVVNLIMFSLIENTLTMPRGLLCMFYFTFNIITMTRKKITSTRKKLKFYCWHKTVFYDIPVRYYLPHNNMLKDTHNIELTLSITQFFHKYVLNSLVHIILKRVLLYKLECTQYDPNKKLRIIIWLKQVYGNS